MIMRTTLVAAMAAVALLTASGCSVTRGQQTVGSYADDTWITSKVKGSFAEDKEVAATSISVETMSGTVMLSGFAKSAREREKAESIARSIKGVKAVKNEIAVRP